MLKPTRVTLSWQRLIGVASGTFGAALTIATGAQLSVAGSIRAQTLQEITLICGCVFLFLAFPLFAGREWARRALIFTTYCILAALAIFLSFTVFQQSRSPAAVYPGLRLIIGVCALISFLTPPAFLLAVLHHADVRRAFQARDASNQSLQPTAGCSAARLKDEL
jgi:hypothetical protein